MTQRKRTESGRTIKWNCFMAFSFTLAAAEALVVVSVVTTAALDSSSLLAILDFKIRFRARGRIVCHDATFEFQYTENCCNWMDLCTNAMAAVDVAGDAA